MKLKAITGCIMLSFIVIVFSETLYAANIVINRTGAIKIINPDGTALTASQDESLPMISAGSTIEILEGSSDVSFMEEGFIKILALDSMAILNNGDVINVSIEKKTGSSNFTVNSGAIEITAGNTVIKLKNEQKVTINFNKATGAVEAKSLNGEIETVTAGVNVNIPTYAAVIIKIDPKTKMVNVTSIEGESIVMSIDGKKIMLAKADSINTESTIEGEIQSFAEGETAAAPPALAMEEPAEPERPEASPHRP